MTFEKEIRELLDLSLRVLKETEHHVKLEVDDQMCCVYIMHNGFRNKGIYDGMYFVFSDIENRSAAKENYEKAKAHLTRLLEEETKDEKDRD